MVDLVPDLILKWAELDAFEDMGLDLMIQSC